MEKMLVSVIATMDYRYPIVYCGAWSFKYISPEEKDNGGLDADWQAIEENAQTYLGIHINFQKLSNPHEAYKQIISQIKQHKATVFTLKENACYWHSKLGLSSTNEHTLIVCGCTDEGILCTDCQPPTEKIFFSKEDFLQSYNGLLVSFQQESPLCPPELSVKNAFKRISSKSKQLFPEMETFAHYISHANLSLECAGNSEADIWNSSLLFNIKNLSLGRIHFSSYLKFIVNLNQNDSLVNCAKLLEKSGQQWATVRSLLMKALLTGNPESLQNRAEKLILDCKSLEEQALRETILSFH